MTLVDRMFLYQSSGTAMAAAFTGSIVWFALLCLPLGVCAYANTFVAQYHGDRRPERIGPSVWQAAWFALIASPFVIALIPLAPMIFRLADHGPEAMEQEILYFQILCVGGPGLLIAQALSTFYSGRGRTMVVMGVDTFVALVNVVLDYLLIFGYGGFPEMGIAGAGWGTVIALWLKAIIYGVLILQRQHRKPFQTLAGIRWDRNLFGRLVYFGGPSGVQMMLDVLGFTAFVLLVSRLGKLEAEATTLAFSVGTVAFMPVWGFSMATSILVGQRLGENRDDLAARATWTSLVVALAYMALISALFVFTPDLFFYGFFNGNQAPAAQREALRTMAANLLCFVATYNLLDAMLMIFASAIKGAGDTLFVLRVSVVMATLLAGLSWFFVEVRQVNIYGCWTLIAGWIAVMGVMFCLRFLQGKWRTMRVIEPS